MGCANEKFQLDKIIKLEEELRHTKRALEFMTKQYGQKVDDYLCQKELSAARLERVRELETELSEIAVASDYVCIDPDCLCNKE